MPTLVELCGRRSWAPNLSLRTARRTGITVPAHQKREKDLYRNWIFANSKTKQIPVQEGTSSTLPCPSGKGPRGGSPCGEADRAVPVGFVRPCRRYRPSSLGAPCTAFGYYGHVRSPEYVDLRRHLGECPSPHLPQLQVSFVCCTRAASHPARLPDGPSSAASPRSGL